MLFKKTRCFLSRIPIVFLLSVIAPTALAQERSFEERSRSQKSGWKKNVRMTSRTILTSGSDTYTSQDVVVLLTLWKIFSRNKADIQYSFWLDQFRIKKDPEKDVSLVFVDWPEEVKTFLYITLIWNETNRSQLFQSQTSEIEQARQIVKNEVPKIKSLPTPIKTYIDDLSSEELDAYLKKILRAVTFVKVRGNWTKNIPILQSNRWFWHDE